MRKLGLTKTLMVLAAAAASGFAAAALAAPSPTPSQLCKAERADAGFAAAHDGKTFAQFYGANKKGKTPLGKCVSMKAKAKAKPPTTTTTTTTATVQTPSPSEARASAACRAEQADAGFAAAHGGKTFTQHYGANKGQQNAFGKCVSSKAKPSTS